MLRLVSEVLPIGTTIYRLYKENDTCHRYSSNHRKPFRSWEEVEEWLALTKSRLIKEAAGSWTVQLPKPPARLPAKAYCYGMPRANLNDGFLKLQSLYRRLKMRQVKAQQDLAMWVDTPNDQRDEGWSECVHLCLETLVETDMRLSRVIPALAKVQSV